MIGAWKEMCESFYTVQFKSLGRCIALDQLLKVRELDCTRCKAMAIEFMFEETKKRGYE
jgi:hypothetical protein